MRVTVDEDRCRGHGMCLTMCPEIFSLSDDGYAVAEPEEVPDELQESAREAVANCPERAIIETND